MRRIEALGIYGLSLIVVFAVAVAVQVAVHIGPFSSPATATTVARDTSIVALQREPAIHALLIRTLGLSSPPQASDLPAYQDTRDVLQRYVTDDQVVVYILTDRGYAWTAYNPSLSEVIWIPASVLTYDERAATSDVTRVYLHQGHYLATRILYDDDGKRQGVVGITYRAGYTPQQTIEKEIP